MKQTIVSEPAVVARIKRKLAHEGKTISFGPNPWCSSERVWRQVENNTITANIDDLEAYAKDLSVMHQSERLG
jgi:hypothetical protein